MRRQTEMSVLYTHTHTPREREAFSQRTLEPQNFQPSAPREEGMRRQTVMSVLYTHTHTPREREAFSQRTLEPQNFQPSAPREEETPRDRERFSQRTLEPQNFQPSAPREEGGQVAMADSDVSPLHTHTQRHQEEEREAFPQRTLENPRISSPQPLERKNFQPSAPREKGMRQTVMSVLYTHTHTQRHQRGIGEAFPQEDPGTPEFPALSP
ncbi:hypothetical protein RRG08_066466 [Elysia crispata]|uniref:Uncharacterized protein n=1 Tax=Elysia crispata TaxID=231223 RepID=A0AAE0YU04_9GAST|nr:hypothetical protein RRG08_066466 [Elysia crispata]